MRCLRCGSSNIDENLICKDCGFVSVKDIKKSNPIDITEYKKKEIDNFQKTKKIVLNLIIIFLLLFVITGLILVLHILKLKSNSKIINDFNEFKTNSLMFVLYVSNNDTYDDMLTTYANNYEFDYLRIDYNSLAIENKKYLKKENELKDINNYFVIWSNGKIVNKTKINNEEELNTFLKDNYVIPNIIENPFPEMEKLNNKLVNEKATLIYISFVNNELLESKNELLSSLCQNYDIEYQFIKGYIMSRKQQMKYINQFGFTEIKNELILIVENGKIKNVLDKNYLVVDDYIEIFQNYDIIMAISEYLDYIDFNQFKLLVEGNEKEVFTFGDDDCQYCDNIKYSLGIISKENNVKIHYINLTGEDNIKEELDSLGYDNAITYPITIVVEDNKVLDYVIGASDEEYFINFFTKLGIIR